MTPSSLYNLHTLQLIDLVDVSRGDTSIIMSNAASNIELAIVCFEALNDSLIKRLDNRGEVWCKVLNMDAAQVTRDDMARKVVL